MPATTKIDVLLRLIEVHLSCDLFVLTEKSCRVISSLNRYPFLLIRNDICTSWNQLPNNSHYMGQEFTRIRTFSDWNWPKGVNCEFLQNSCPLLMGREFTRIHTFSKRVPKPEKPPQMKLGMLILVNSLPIRREPGIYKDSHIFWRFWRITKSQFYEILRQNCGSAAFCTSTHISLTSQRSVEIMEIYCHTFLAKILWKQRFY